MVQLPTRVHVAMIVGNDVTTDTRVKKSAASLARHGYQVTVLGLSPNGTRTETSMGQVKIIRLPVDYVLRDHRRAGHKGVTLPHFAYTTKAQYLAAKRRNKISEREFLAYAGRQQARLARSPQSTPPLLAKIDRRRAKFTVTTRGLVVKARRRIVEKREALWRAQSSDERDGHQRLLRSPVIHAMASAVSWRRLVPVLNDFELSLGPELDKLEPDVIHAHDFPMIGIAERAAARGRLRGRTVKWIYDAHEYVPGVSLDDPRIVGAYVKLEREYIREADRVITVSAPIADELMRRFGLDRRPSVVMNAPLPVPSHQEASVGVRQTAGLADDVPLLVYSGGMAAHRGVHTIVDALPLLPGTHLALVVKSESPYVESLRRSAEGLGCGDRLHVVPFVGSDEVVTYLSSATAGVHPLVHCGNHEVALPNKLFEYLHARLPVIVSDVKAMAELTRQLGVGEVFRAEDPASFADAATKVLSAPDLYRRPLDEKPEILDTYSWPTQEKVLVDVYRDLLDRAVPPTPPIDLQRESLAEVAIPQDHTHERVVALGTRNMAGQAWEWGKALERQYGGIRTRVFTVEKPSPIKFPTDVRIPAASWKSLEWQLSHLRHVLETYTHVVLESGVGLFGTLNGASYEGDLPSLRAHGIKVAIALHGSEIRDPRRHRELEPYSPFKDASTELSQRLQAHVDGLLPRLERFDGPVFVTTMDLLDYVPHALWLPVVVDTGLWTLGSQPLERARPVVVHAPSHAGLKGSALIEGAMNDLQRRGLIEYRRVDAVPSEEMPQVISDADIVLDQFLLGDYGAVAVQGMAMGRVVVGHVHERVRARLPAELPIVEATADSLGEVLETMLQDRDTHRERATNDGPTYVRRFHDGTYAAAQLADFLGQPAPSGGPQSGQTRSEARQPTMP